MRAVTTPAVLVLLLIVSGCVAKSELEETQAELTECLEEKTHAEGDVKAWENRYDRESGRWNELEASVSEALPRALGEFHSERQRILELVPDQVQTEVSRYLEDYFSTVMKGFELLSTDNADIKLELRATQKALEVVGADARGIRIAVDEALVDERDKRDEMSGRLAELSGYLGDIVEQVVEFDQTRVNCKTCPDRLRLNRKERETVLAFHAELMSDLSDLQSRTAGPSPPAVEPTSFDEGEAGTGEDGTGAEEEGEATLE
ncbi:MAG: hypothetical protein V3T72_05280 [Thermoanaerobaculia bacterium]